MENGIDGNSCALCLDAFVEPKSLMCGHTFCKECVDSLLKFRYNGSALITCPMKCAEETPISIDDTSNSLATKLEQLVCLDLSTINEDSKALCQWNECDRKITSFCPVCNTSVCDVCWSEHSNTCNCDEPISVKYDYKMKDISVVCRNHNTRATFICLNCKYEFICMYCKYRNHKGHFVENIQKTLVRLKSSIDNERASIQISRTAIEELDNCEQQLIAELKRRKLKCLFEYLSMLNEEESNILLNFREQSSIVKDMVNAENGGKLVANYDSGIDMDDRITDFEMLLARKRKLFSQEKFCSIPSVEFNLGPPVSLSDEPLGNFCAVIGKVKRSQVEVNQPVCFEFQQTEIDLANSDFLQDLEDCFYHGTALPSAETEPEETESKLNPDAIPVFFPTNNINAAAVKEVQSNLNPEAIPVFYPCSSLSLAKSNEETVKLDPSAEDFTPSTFKCDDDPS